MRTSDQLELDIVAEKFTEREKKIRALLREYRTIDRRIEYYERLAKGDGLLHQPSVTAAPPVEDDPWVLTQRATEPLTEAQHNMVSVLQKYLSPAITYATCARVANQLSATISDDRDEDEILQMAFAMFREASAGEERVELTDTERIAILREREINQARQRLETLRENKRHVGYALDTMREFYEYDYNLLWWRYVEERDVQVVRKMLRPEFELTRDEWINHRRKAMHEFARWVPRHLVGGESD